MLLSALLTLDLPLSFFSSFPLPSQTSPPPPPPFFNIFFMFYVFGEGEREAGMGMGSWGWRGGGFATSFLLTSEDLSPCLWSQCSFAQPHPKFISLRSFGPAETSGCCQATIRRRSCTAAEGAISVMYSLMPVLIQQMPNLLIIIYTVATIVLAKSQSQTD